MAKLNEGIYCAKCSIQMKLGALPRYKYEEGYPLHNVSVFRCPKCNKTFFTEEQAHEMEARTKEIIPVAKEGFMIKKTVN